jgi:hypothetical protein
MQRAFVIEVAGLLGPVACSSDGNDTSGAGASEADTDTDSDADTDTDEDAGWHGDTLAVDLAFGWDALTSQVVPTTVNEELMPNAATITIFNFADNELDAPTRFCALGYALDGATAADARFATYWTGFDLSSVIPEVGISTDHGVGDCEGLASFIDVTRGTGQPVDEFVTALGFGAGVGDWDNVDFETAQDWESYWTDDGLDGTYGAWGELEPYFAVAGFTSAVGRLEAEAPAPFGIAFAYALDAKRNVALKDKQLVAIDLSSASVAPTAYFQTRAMYVYGTAF